MRLRSVGPPRSPLVFKTRWQLTVCDGQKGTINDARTRFYARAGFLFVFVREFLFFLFLFFFFNIHWLAQHVGSH